MVWLDKASFCVPSSSFSLTLSQPIHSFHCSTKVQCCFGEGASQPSKKKREETGQRSYWTTTFALPYPTFLAPIIYKHTFVFSLFPFILLICFPLSLLLLSSSCTFPFLSVHTLSSALPFYSFFYSLTLLLLKQRPLFTTHCFSFIYHPPLEPLSSKSVSGFLSGKPTWKA